MLCSSSNLGRPINIAAWLSQIPDDICLEHIHRADLDRNVEKSLNKRKRRPLLVSPPPSHPGPSFSSSDGEEALPLNMADTPSGKRQKRHHQTAPGSPTDQPLSQDPDATPTQGRQAPGIYTASLGTQTPTASDHESSLSSVSGQSSPTKRLAAVSLGNAPFDTKEYNSSVQRPPAGPAFDMFEKMEYLDNNEGLLPEAMRPVFLEYTKNRKVSRIGNAAFDNSGQRDALGPTPPIDHVLDLVHEAMRCQELLALHGADGRKRQLVDFDSCTHAKPLAAYRSKSGSSTTHMVDFCINLCPRQAGSHHAPAVEAIDVLRTELTDNSINHTGHNPLLRDPISVSIETKRPDEGGQKQALQMVLVRGHDWYFAATMREGHKKILWREVSMGSTRNVLGIYRIIYAIQLLAEYSRDHFWPWYLRAVLGISTAGDANMATTSDENMTMTSDTDITADADQSIGADG
uniref:PD-(D/E)XK nuclease-like domain-containing protein n=1 Tax=Colletotrichum fructicola (strain Nara gc5) TaxID=1213859 RepID=L2GAI6_COLFN